MADHHKFKAKNGLLVKGANDNSGKADFSVNTGGGPTLSLHGGQVQIGASDMNWNGKISYIAGSGVYLSAWDTDLRLTTNGGASAGARNIRFAPQASGGSSTERMIITGAGKVGIGTSSPVYKFEVSDGVRTGVFNPNSSLDGFFIGTYQNKPLIFGTNDTQRMRLAASGNLGINTTSPGTKLDVYDAGASVNIIRARNATQAIAMGVNNDSGGAFLFVNTNHALRFGTNGSERVRITNTGNVGIGTTSPSEKLTVSGNIQAENATFTGTGDVTVKIVADTDNVTETDNPTLGFSQDGNTTGTLFVLGLEGNANTVFPGSIVNAPYIHGNVSAAPLQIGNKGKLVADFDSTATNAALTVTKFSNISGTSNGSTILNLKNYMGSGTADGDLSQQKSFIDFQMLDSNANEVPQVRIGAEVGENGDANSQAKEGSGAFVVYTNDADTDSGDAGSSLTEKLRVDYQGNVGIGTSSPTAKLDLVNGSLHLSTGYNLSWGGNYNTGKPTISATGSAIIFYPTGNSDGEVIRIDADGIDMNSHNLTEVNNITATGLTVLGRTASDRGSVSDTNTALVVTSRGVDHTSSRTNVLRLQRDGTSSVTYTGLADIDLERWESSSVASRTAMHFRLGHDNLNTISETTVPTVMTLRSNGHVGIGTTSPSATLHVTDGGTSGETTFSANGRITLRGDGVLNWGGAADYGTLTWDTGKASIYGQSGKDLWLGAHGTQGRVRIDSSGRLNIVNNALLIESTTALDKSGNYMIMYDGSGAPAIYAGNTGDNRNYYQSNHHRWRSDNAGTDFAELSAAGLHIGGTSTPSEKLQVTGNAKITGDALINNQNFGANGNGASGMGFGYKSATFSRPVGTGVQWIKIGSFAGGVKTLTVRINSSGDNTNAIDVFVVSLASYGFKANILKLPSTKYNSSKLQEIRTKHVSGATYELWIKMAAITTSAGNLYVSMNDSGCVSTLSAGTEPTVGSNDATLPVSPDDRNNYAIQATNQISSEGGYAVGSTTRINSVGDIIGTSYYVGGTNIVDTSRNGIFSGVQGTGVGVDNTSSSTKRGIALYGGYGSATNPTYGIMFTGTSGSGTHGFVTGDWATYFTMDGTANRGWIFRNQSNSSNVASISNSGKATFTEIQTYTTDGASNTNKINLGRGGAITFYGNANHSHAIMGRNASGSVSDNIRINSYAGVFINLDSNNNNTSNADFIIGRHGSGTGTMSTLLTVGGENGNLTLTGDINLPTAGRIYFGGSTNFGVGAGGHNYRSVYVDTVESGSSTDPLELVYYQGSSVKIGPGVGTKPLYAGSYHVDGKKFIDMPTNSPERGPWNPIVSSIRGSGRMLYTDEDFADGTNGVQVYNNSGGGTVTITREDATTSSGGNAPNSSGKVLKIYWNGGTASPNRGGFYQSIPSEDNHTFVQVFQAKLPSGSTLHINENPQGSNNTSYFLTDNVGTGKWEWYARISHCGNSGTFSSGGHISVSGPSSAFSWYLASCTCFDITETPKLWSAWNDGASSGLDADLLDGQHGSYYTNAGNLNAGTIPEARLPTQSKYLRSDAADTWNGLLTYNGSNNGLEVGGIRGTALGSQTGDFIHLYERVNIGYPSGWGASGAAAPSYGLSTWGGAQINVGNVSGAPFTFNGNTVWHAGNDGSGSGLDADLLDGLQLHTGRNNEANKVVRTDGNGYIQAGWINTTSGSTTGMDRIYASNDGYIRYVSKGTFGSGIAPHLTGIGSYTGDPGDNMLQYWQASGNSTLNPTGDWYNAIRMGHGDPVTYYGNTIAVKMTGSGIGNLYTRTLSNGTQQSWNLHWHANNDGSGSGLDADLLDGQHGSYYTNAGNLNAGTIPEARLPTISKYLRSDTTDSFTGDELHFPTLDLSISNNNSQNNGNTYFRGNGTHFVLGMNSGNTFYCNYGNGAGDFRLDGNVYHNNSLVGNKIWGNSNDGSGSGLDADLVDGVEGSRIIYGQNATGSTNTQPSQTLKSGFYDIYNNNTPTGTWYSYINIRHNNVSNNHGHQIAGSFYDNNLWNRNINNGSFGSWSKSWSSNNDGSGSGLDADLLDGQDGSYYRNASNLNAGTLSAARVDTTVQQRNKVGFYVGGTADKFYLVKIPVSQKGDRIKVHRVYSWTIGGSSSYWNSGSTTHFGALHLQADLLRNDWGGHRSMVQGTVSHNYTVVCARAQMGQAANHGEFHIWLRGGAGGSGAYYEYELEAGGTTAPTVDYNSYLTSADAQFNDIWANHQINIHMDEIYVGTSSYKVWHAGNDGSGSGLDADTVDGVHESSFMRKSANSGLDMNNNNITEINTLQIADPGPTEGLEWMGGNGWKIVECPDDMSTNSSGNLQFATGSTRRMTVRSDGKVQFSSNLMRSAHHTGHLEGSYNNIAANGSKSNPIYTIGSSYNPNDASLNNMYGIGYCRANQASFVNMGGASNWGMYVAADGDARIFLDGGNGHVVSSGEHYAGNGGAANPAYSFINDTDSGMFSLGSNAVGFGTGGAQRFKINSNGLLLTGTSHLYINGQRTITNARSIENIVNITNTDGYLEYKRTGAAPAIFNRMGTTGSTGTSRGEIVNFKSNNTKVGRIGYAAPYGGLLYFAIGNSSGYGVGVYNFNTSSHLQPTTHTGANHDNAMDLGSTSARWDDVYATNGTIQTSDRNEKQDIQALTTAETAAATACKGLIRRFRWIDSVEEKGDDARYHFGAIAQDVEAAFTAQGLDAGDYGLFIRSTWWEHEGNSYPTAEAAPTGAVEKTRLGIRYNQLFAFIISAL